MLAGRLDALERQLAALSPAAVLGRGYSITLLKNGQIVRSVGQLQPGARILTRLRDGQSESIVQDTRQLLLFE
jgi:exodeoxyribonuclease VII large subunit